MNIAFIYEDNSNLRSLKDRINQISLKLLRKVEVKDIINDNYKNIAINKIIICIPKYKYNKIDNKLMKNLIYVLKQNSIKNIVLSKELNQKKLLKNTIYSHNYNILDGRFLIKTSTIDILEYIMKNVDSNINKEEISILVNENSKINLDIITNIANNAKRVNIITNNIAKFKKLEKKLYEEKGIMISIGNNKKKGLSKSKYIVNMDFTEELLNKYKIYKRAILINIENICKINTKLFSGIIINNIEIKYDNNIDLKDKFDRNETYETSIIAIDNLQHIDIIKQKDNFKIVNTIGNNGIINQNEYYFTKKLQ